MAKDEQRMAKGDIKPKGNKIPKAKPAKFGKPKRGKVNASKK